MPAVALLENTIVPESPEVSTAVTKFCVVPELFVMPLPLRVRVELGLAVMVYGFAAADVKVMPLTSVVAEIETFVVFERSNVAVSPDPLGTVAGVQLPAVFQSPEAGVKSQVALPALAITGSKNIRPLPINAAINFFIELNSPILTDERELPAEENHRPAPSKNLVVRRHQFFGLMIRQNCRFFSSTTASYGLSWVYLIPRSATPATIPPR